MICKEEFKSKAKVFNPLDYKTTKIAIKDAILSKIPSIPNGISCCEKFEEKKLKLIQFREKFFIEENLSDIIYIVYLNNLSKFIEKKNLYFSHKEGCDGILIEGIINEGKIIVCSKCKILVKEEKYVWYC